MENDESGRRQLELAFQAVHAAERQAAQMARVAQTGGVSTEQAVNVILDAQAFALQAGLTQLVSAIHSGFVGVGGTALAGVGKAAQAAALQSVQSEGTKEQLKSALKLSSEGVIEEQLKIALQAVQAAAILEARAAAFQAAHADRAMREQLESLVRATQDMVLQAVRSAGLSHGYVGDRNNDRIGRPGKILKR